MLVVVHVGRGGQSALRFARLRMEKRHNYVRKVAETAVQMFITNDRANVAGLVLAGSADFKTELSQSDMFDQVRWTIWQIRHAPDELSCVISYITALIVRRGVELQDTKKGDKSFLSIHRANHTAHS